MQLVLAIAVALLIVGVVAWPLLVKRRRPAAERADHDSPLDDSGSLESVYEAIRTLQMEHSLGRISDADFREQLDEYRRQAAVILRDMDRDGRNAHDE